MRDFIEGIIIVTGFILVVLGVRLLWDWNEYVQMDRELELWKRDLVVERHAEANNL